MHDVVPRTHAGPNHPGRRPCFGSPRMGPVRLTACQPKQRLGFRKKTFGWRTRSVWLGFGLCETQRNLSHSQTRRTASPHAPAVETGPATAAGTLYRPTKPAAPNLRNRRATVAPKFGSYVKPVISASPATADSLTQKPPALPHGAGCPRHILHGNRRSAPCRSAAPSTKP